VPTDGSNEPRRGWRGCDLGWVVGLDRSYHFCAKGLRFGPNAQPSPTLPKWTLLGTNPRLLCRTYNSWTLGTFGNLDQARQWSRDSLMLEEGQPSAFGLAKARNCAAWLHILRRQWPEARAQAEALLALATQLCEVKQDRGADPLLEKSRPLVRPGVRFDKTKRRTIVKGVRCE
jgi:hypothetical protein